VDPHTIDHIQAHGTATTVGDPIEVAALTWAFAQGGRNEPGVSDGDLQARCVIGAVKANIGHTDTAAGVAGLLATVLAMQNETLPPVAHLVKPNPEVGFERTPFAVLAHAEPWQWRGHPRRAGVSSFGMGGTNAHVVVEEPPPQPAGEAQPHRLLVLTAHTPAALEAATVNLAVHLRQHRELSMDDVAYTLQIGRAPFPYRRFAVVTDHDDAIEVLSGRAPGRLVTSGGPCQQRPDRPVPDLPATSPEELAELGRLWLSGTAVRWQLLHRGKGRRRVPLPTYPFQRQRHILEMLPWHPPTATPPATRSPAGALAADAAAPATRSGSPTTTLDSARLIFEEVLGVAEVDPDDDFFSLGGDSLVAAQLADRFEEVFGVAVPLDIVFESPTPRQLADGVEALRAEQALIDGTRP
jgi:acyl transferase domain-containing protein